MTQKLYNFLQDKNNKLIILVITLICYFVSLISWIFYSNIMTGIMLLISGNFLCYVAGLIYWFENFYKNKQHDK